MYGRSAACTDSIKDDALLLRGIAVVGAAVARVSRCHEGAGSSAEIDMVSFWRAGFVCAPRRRG